jgi:hypothetical protein
MSSFQKLALVVGNMIFDENCTLVCTFTREAPQPVCLNGGEARQLAENGTIPAAWALFGRVHCNLETCGLMNWTASDVWAFHTAKQQWEPWPDREPVRTSRTSMPILCWVDGELGYSATS